jgi:hypothetical protein
MFEVQKVDGPDMIFGGNMKKLLPTSEMIPAEFWKSYNKYNSLVSTWFFCGLKNLNAIPVKGVDRKEALNHLQAILSSWEPKHEHKTAAVAWLISEWFTAFEGESAKEL